jgi:hypothetical protein
VTVLVLAGSIREATAWSSATGNRIRYAANAGVVDGAGRSISHIVELPSWNGYRARHPVNAAVRAHRRKYGTPYTVTEDWDYEGYLADQADKTLQRVGEALAGNATARREVLVTAANRAVEALAADLCVPVEQLLIDALDIFGVPNTACEKPKAVKDREADPDVEPSPEPAPFAEPDEAEVARQAGVTVHDGAQVIDLAAELRASVEAAKVRRVAAQEGDAETKPAAPKPRTKRKPVRPAPPTVNAPAEF